MAQGGEPQDDETPENAANQNDASGSLRESFPGHFRPTAEEFDRLWGEGMFVVDTNVLLNLYRYSRSTRDELLRVLRALEDKLFLPHQVGQEFLDRRLTTIRTQREGFSKLRKRVTDIRGEMQADLRKVLRLRPGEDLPEGLRDALEEVPSGGYETLAERLQALEKDLPRASTSPDDDEVWAAVESLVEGKVGPAYQDKELRKAEEEAERRRNEKIPPGFKDQRPGDYVLWRQTIDEAKRSGRSVVLITDDRKEDWWWIEQGETIGPQPALVAEMRKEARVPFYMYTPDRLMGGARDRLDVEVSDESISEAEGLGRDTRDDAISADEMFGTLYSLTEDEKRALEKYVIDGNIDRVAQELGISHTAASSLVDHALVRLRNELAHRDPRHLSWSESDWENVGRLVGRRDYSLKRPEPLVSSVYVRLEGDEDSIVTFNKTLLKNYPQVETIGRRPADEGPGDVALELSFRPPVPFDYAAGAIERTAVKTRVNVLSYTYSHFIEP